MVSWQLHGPLLHVQMCRCGIGCFSARAQTHPVELQLVLTAMSALGGCVAHAHPHGPELRRIAERLNAMRYANVACSPRALVCVLRVRLSCWGISVISIARHESITGGAAVAAAAASMQKVLPHGSLALHRASATNTSQHVRGGRRGRSKKPACSPASLSTPHQAVCLHLGHVPPECVVNRCSVPSCVPGRQ